VAGTFWSELKVIFFLPFAIKIYWTRGHWVLVLQGLELRLLMFHVLVFEIQLACQGNAMFRYVYGINRWKPPTKRYY